MFEFHRADVRMHISTTFAEWGADFEWSCVRCELRASKLWPAKKQVLLGAEREE
jgi:hypothetical protein